MGLHRGRFAAYVMMNKAVTGHFGKGMHMVSEHVSIRFGWIAALFMVLALALCLAGCGDQQSSGESSSGEAAESQEIVVSDDVAVVSDAVTEIAESGDVEGADDIDALPKREVAPDEELEAPEIEASTDEASKYSGDLVLVRQGGVQMVVPAAWQMGTQDAGVAFANPDGNVLCVVNSYPKEPGEVVPLEALAKVMPQQLANKGLSDVEVINYGTNYSKNGTLCTSFVFCSGKFEGTEFYVYDQFVDSKSYLNVLEFVAPSSAFKANFDAIKTATNSLCFAPGEEI